MSCWRRRTHWAVGKALTLQELAGEPFLLREEGSGSRHVIDEHMRDSGVQLKVRLSLASNEAIRELVASGMGLTVLSRQALGDMPGHDGLAILDVAGFPLKRKWSVVHLRTKVLSLPARAFLADLLQQRPATPPNFSRPNGLESTWRNDIAVAIRDREGKDHGKTRTQHEQPVRSAWPGQRRGGDRRNSSKRTVRWLTASSSTKRPSGHLRRPRSCAKRSVDDADWAESPTN